MLRRPALCPSLDPGGGSSPPFTAISQPLLSLDHLRDASGIWVPLGRGRRISSQCTIVGAHSALLFHLKILGSQSQGPFPAERAPSVGQFAPSLWPLCQDSPGPLEPGWIGSERERACLPAGSSEPPLVSLSSSQGLNRPRFKECCQMCANKPIKPNALAPFVCGTLRPNISHSESHLKRINSNSTKQPLVG